MSITKVSDFNIDNIFVSEVKKNKAGGEAVYLKHDNNNIILQTDLLNILSNSENTVEFNCDETTFLDRISELEILAHQTFGGDESNLRTIISDSNSIKLNITEGNTMMFDSKKNNIDTIENNSNVQILVQPAGIWYKNQEYGVSLKLLQVKVLEKDSSLQEYSFVDDENDYYDVIPNDF